MRTQEGFTLIELMIAVAVVAILTMIAVPGYRGYTERAARANVQAELAAAAAAIERRKSMTFSYGGATAGPLPTDTIPSYSPSDGDPANAKYTLAIVFLNNFGAVASATDVVGGFEIRAVSTNKFANGKSEALKIDHVGRRCYKPLAAGVLDCVIGTDSTWK